MPVCSAFFRVALDADLHSPCNPVEYDEEQKCGVLHNHDLSISPGILQHVPGTPAGRTGTIPFMAIDLLTDAYWNGEIERLYRHELETFLWILPFIFMRYQNGQAQQTTSVDGWMTSDYVKCAMEKLFFLHHLSSRDSRCKNDYQDLWKLVFHLFDWQKMLFNGLGNSKSESDTSNDSDIVNGNDLISVWLPFVAVLKKVAVKYSHLSYIGKLVDELELERLFEA